MLLIMFPMLIPVQVIFADLSLALGTLHPHTHRVKPMTPANTNHSPTIHSLLHNRAANLLSYTGTPSKATSSPGFSPMTTRTFRNPSAAFNPISPSVYSTDAHTPHASARRQYVHTGRSASSYYPDDMESEEGNLSDDDGASCTRSRISMVSGPTVRKYSNIPWDDLEPSQDRTSVAGGLGRMIRAATRASSSQLSVNARSRPASPTAVAQGHYAKRPILSSTSEASLSSANTISSSSSGHRSNLLTPKSSSRRPSPVEGQFLGRPFEEQGGHDRHGRLDKQQQPLHTTIRPSGQPTSPDPPNQYTTKTGSQGFGLISLEVAQERERSKYQPPAQKALPAVTPGRTPLRDRTNISHSLDMATPGRMSYASTHSMPPDHPPVPPRSVKSKKSGLMKLFKSDKTASNQAFAMLNPVSVPKVQPVQQPVSSGIQRIDSAATAHQIEPPSRQRAAEVKPRVETPKAVPASPHLTVEPNLLKPKLELRPVSMNFAGALPSSYLADLPESPEGLHGSISDKSLERVLEDMPSEISTMVQEKIAATKKSMMHKVFELEAQVRELRDKIEEEQKRKLSGCHVCGCECGMPGGDGAKTATLKPNAGVMDRGRAKTGGARGVFGSGSLYEWE